VGRPAGDPLRAALDRLTRRGVRLGEARLVEREVQWLKVRNGKVDVATTTREAGVGVRALAGGWGFAASRDTAAAGALADRAVDLAEAARPAAYGRIDVGAHPPRRGEWRSPAEIDPLSVPLSEKLDVLMGGCAAMEGADVTRGAILSLKLKTRFVNTEGSDWAQEQIVCGVSLSATAVGDGTVQVRSWPKSMEGNLAGRGWEHVLEHDLAAEGPRLTREARLLTEAEPVPSGAHDVVLDPSQLSLQIHESVGHPSEGDRALGEEMSLAGGSFLQPAWRGEAFGSPGVNLYADATHPGAAGSFGWDDEGSPSTRVDLVREGRFVGWLSGREAAARLGCAPAAAMRAESWSGIPIVRMVNVNLAPGDAGDRAALIASTERGLLLSGNRSWSIDQLRLNFQFGCEIAWRIEDGEIVGLYRDPVYTGKTPTFWRSCDAICGPEAWGQWGWAFCGKGDPPQIMFVSHGCAPARFRGVTLL